MPANCDIAKRASTKRILQPMLTTIHLLPIFILRKSLIHRGSGYGLNGGLMSKMA
jgi:hypothetical protein